MHRLAVHSAFWITLLGWQTVFAAGTPANTAITTQATAEYTIGATTLTQVSNAVTATVAEVLNVHATWQDSTPVVANPMDTNRILTFRFTNTGNGNEAFALTGTGAVSGNQFDPIISAIYLDSNDNNLFEPGTDARYRAGVTDLTLTPDAAMTVFVSSTMPGDPNDGDQGNCQISVTSLTGTGSPGDAMSGMGDGGTDAIFGASGASAEAIGTYAISNVIVSVIKSATVLDPQGGTVPTTGAVMTYRVEVQVSGTGTARAVVFNDLIPSNTAYRPQTLHLNGVQLSDAQDGDAGDVDVSVANSVSVDLGDLADSSAVQTITFEVTIN